MKKTTVLTATLGATLVTASFYATYNPSTGSTMSYSNTKEEGLFTFNTVSSPIKFGSLLPGGAASFTIEDYSIRGIINTVQVDVQGVTRIGGDFAGGSFCFAIDEGITTGIVMFHTKGICFEMVPCAFDEEVKWIKKSLSKIACFEFPEGGEGALQPSSTATIVTTQQMVPILNSRPSAPITLFLDFIGGSIQDPLFNGGKLINATPANFTANQIKNVFDIAAERFSAFNVNVTTDSSKYITAQAGNRMRVIITSNTFMPYAGYAFINSFRSAGKGYFSLTVPCFVFSKALYYNPRYVGEAIAHEFGHTFGLRHDGIKKGTSYYAGQGQWASIMGAAYYAPVVQWNKGEYTNSDNTQDDLATITSNPKVTYLTSTNDKTPIVYTLGTDVEDVVSNSNTIRYFDLNITKSGTLQMNVKVPQYGGLNSAIEIRSGTQLLTKNNPINNVDSSASCQVKPGKYTVVVYGEGEGDPKTTGYSSYGSIGTFILNGTLR